MTKDQEKSSVKVFEQRRNTLKKKAETLSTLCNDVCLLCFGPAGDFDSFPEDPSEVRPIIERFQEASRRRASNKRFGKRKLDLSDVLGSKISTLQKQLRGETLDKASDHVDQLSLSRWDEQLDFLDRESLVAVAGCLESNIQAIDNRIGFLNVRKHYQQLPNNGFFLLPSGSGVSQPPMVFNNGFFSLPSGSGVSQPPMMVNNGFFSLPSGVYQSPMVVNNGFFSLPSGSGVSQQPMVVKTNPNNYLRDTY